MGRTYLICVILLGMFGCMMTRGVGPSSSRGAGFEQRVKTAQLGNSYGDDANASTTRPSDGSVELDRASDGHFYADVEINGSKVHALVDTGASVIALSREDARSAGVATSIGMNDVVGQGADGAVHGEVVTLDRIQLGDKQAEKMPAIILNSGEQSLLGQEFLTKFESVQIRGDKMVLR
jgi:clan AA aspartic protease (TIGR02281 family)